MFEPPPSPPATPLTPSRPPGGGGGVGRRGEGPLGVQGRNALKKFGVFSPCEARAGRGLGRGARSIELAANRNPLSLTLSPLLRRGERELTSGMAVVSRCAPSLARTEIVLSGLDQNRTNC